MSMSCPGFEEGFFGSVTIGERGQIVIPADARQELGWQPGEKLLIMRHPIYKGIMAFKIESVREFLDEFARGIERVAEVESTEAPE
jgi:AbrB family looped-hinge helix DNA binding protein